MAEHFTAADVIVGANIRWGLMFKMIPPRQEFIDYAARIAARPAAYLDFIEPPFMADPVAVVVRKGAGFAYAEWRDLKGRKGVTNASESYGDKFDAYMAKELNVARADGVDKAFAALLARQADYLIIGLYPGRDEARRLRIAGKIAFLPKEILSSAMYVAFSKKSKCGALQAAFAGAIKTAADDGQVRQLLQAANKAPSH